MALSLGGRIRVIETLIKELYADKYDYAGLPLVDHSIRVSRCVSAESAPVALLHDTIEDGYLVYNYSLDFLLNNSECYALWLLTRRDEQTYKDYIRAIAASVGEGGRIAREVKHADLWDNLTRPLPSNHQAWGLRKPGGRYESALEILYGERQ